MALWTCVLPYWPIRQLLHTGCSAFLWHNSLWSPKECLRLGIKCCRWHYCVSGTSPPASAMPDDKYSSVENCAGHLVLWLLRPVKLHRINSRINTVIIILCNKMCMCAHARVCVWLISDTWHKVWHLWISVMHTADLIFKNKNTLKKIKTEQV